MSTDVATPPRLHAPPSSLGAWAAWMRNAPIPVQARTAAEVAELAANEDAVDAHLLAEAVGNDPLMTLKVLSHVGMTSRRATDVETVTGALVLMGVGPFFRQFAELNTIEATLADEPEALAGALAVLGRSHRAARFALGFAAHRLDPDAAVIHGAALLHDFAELLLWCHAPGLALEIARRQRADSTLRSATVQREVLGVTLGELQQLLMKSWRLPELLIQLDGDKHVDRTQVKYVLLAVRVARHTAAGWDNAALPDDVADIAALLQLGAGPTLRLLHDIDESDGCNE
jgi:HD-like signal output (HDOD) protein